MQLRQRRLQGFRTETEITPAIPAPGLCWGDLLPALREAKPTCKGLLSRLLPKWQKIGIFPPILGGNHGHW